MKSFFVPHSFMPLIYSHTNRSLWS